MTTVELARELGGVLGPGNVASGTQIEERFRTDILRKSFSNPGVVVRPGSTKDVSTILRIASRTRTPVTALGGNTGLVGGALAEEGGILLSFERMRTIYEIDDMSMTITVDAGVTIEEVQTRADERGLLLPLDLGSRGSATVGGAIATNAGGTRVLRWGMMRDMVLGLEAVLADGTVVASLGKTLKDNAGYHWKQLLIGSEGTLGVITRAVLRLRPAPRSTQTALVATGSVEAAARVLRTLQGRLAGRLSSFELMWPEFYEFVSEAQLAKRPRPLPLGAGMYVLIEALGDDVAADETHFEAALEDLASQGLLEDAVVAQSSRQREDLWAARDDLLDAMALIRPRYAFDVSMAVSDMGRFVENTKQRIAAALVGAKLLFYGHGGDGNLHVAVGPVAGTPDADVLAASAVYEAVRSVGGSISAEHGIGRYKLPYIAFTRSPAELDLMRRLKLALDPLNILNRGKVVPT